MKVSNYKFAKFIAYCTLLIIISIFCSLFIVGDTILKVPLIILNLGFIYLFVRLKTVIIELSGGCISIRKHHPMTFKSFINPFVELPHSCIQNYNITNRLGMGSLVIKVKSKRGKKFTVQISLTGFSTAQKKRIRTSLQSIYVENNSEDTHTLVVA